MNEFYLGSLKPSLAVDKNITQTIGESSCPFVFDEDVLTINDSYTVEIKQV